ncbi:unnamed protein product, partial [Symbiodinium natans]
GSCLDLFQITNGSLPDGVYTVRVRDLDDNVQDTLVFCDMTNGGWYCCRRKARYLSGLGQMLVATARC